MGNLNRWFRIDGTAVRVSVLSRRASATFSRASALIPGSVTCRARTNASLLFPPTTAALKIFGQTERHAELIAGTDQGHNRGQGRHADFDESVRLSQCS